jgi:hypothetical protein
MMMENGADEGGNMPKRSIIVISVMICLVSLLVVLGCGTGDQGPVSRVSPQDLVTAGSGDNQGGPGGGGGGQCGARIIGTSITGACVILDSGCLLVQCTDIATPGWCNTWNSSGGFFNATWYSDQTCAQLGY